MITNISDNIQKIDEQHSILKKEQNKIKADINNFYHNIITIIGLLVAIFSIIGINFSSLSNLTASNNKDFISSILAINLSIVYCLFVLFYILHRVLNGRQNKKSYISDIFLIFSFILQIILIVYFA